MPRPHKQRRVRGNPNSTFFKPTGIPLRTLQHTKLTLFEFEALRLKDVEKFDQQTCAQHMNVSQPTFHRIIQTARRKVACAIVKGHTIRIEKQ
ncbi:MAG: DUF134 domain-containing protein [Candidatus Nanoarchaeia archaeon]